MGLKIGIWSNKTIIKMSAVYYYHYANYITIKSYLRPHESSSLEQLLWELAITEKKGFKRREIYFCLSPQQTQENTLHTEELIRIPWTRGIKADFNRKLNYIPSSEYRLNLSLTQNLSKRKFTPTQAGVYNLHVNYNICSLFFRQKLKRNFC